MVLKDGLGNNFGHFLNKPVVPSYLLKFFLILICKDNFKSNSSPRCFQQLALLTDMLMKSA